MEADSALVFVLYSLLAEVGGTFLRGHCGGGMKLCKCHLRPISKFKNLSCLLQKGSALNELLR